MRQAKMMSTGHVVIMLNVSIHGLYHCTSNYEIRSQDTIKTSRIILCFCTRFVTVVSFIFLKQNLAPAEFKLGNFI